MLNASVIICTYNRSGSLKRTLASLARMEGRDSADWELLVVDNNSKDDTRVVVDGFIRASGVNCRYLFEKEQGLSHARNRGIREAKGEIIAFTDDDVLLDRHWLRNISLEFENGGAACVGGKILPVWERSCPAWLKGDLLNILALQDLGENKIKLANPVIWGANLSFHSSMFRKYGVFDTKLGHTDGKLYGGEETKFVRLLLDKGENVLYCPNVLVHHCIPDSRVKKSYFRKWFYDKGELRALQMGEYRLRNIRGIPLYVIREAGGDLTRYLGKQFTSPRSAFREQLKMIHTLGMIAGRYKYRNRMSKRTTFGII